MSSLLRLDKLIHIFSKTGTCTPVKHIECNIHDTGLSITPYDESKYLERIESLLNFYSTSQHSRMSPNHNMYHIIVAECANDDINTFMDDYAYYMKNMDHNNMRIHVKRDHGTDHHDEDQKQCAISDCIAIKREYGDRNQRLWKLSGQNKCDILVKRTEQFAYKMRMP
eukprot:658613_1